MKTKPISVFKFWVTLATLTFKTLAERSHVPISVIRRIDAGTTDNIDGRVLYDLHVAIKEKLSSFAIRPPTYLAFCKDVLLHKKLDTYDPERAATPVVLKGPNE